MRTICEPSQIIRRSQQEVYERHRSGGTADIIETILYADSRSGGFVANGVECLRGANQYETLRNVWAFVKGNITYRADKAGHERVKSPGALFAIGSGDCKSYSIAIGAILRALGISYRYRFAAYGPGDVTHVYVVADGTRGPVVIDAVSKKPFGEEERYYFKKDIRPGKPSVNGIGGIQVDFSKLAINITLLLLLFYSLRK